MSWLSNYAGRRVSLLTQHGKEQVVAPVLEQGLGCVIEHVTGFDTDQLGTFTRDVPRPGSQLDAARRKARKGMELSGLSLGLASEGSFGPDPFSGMFPWNVELLVWLDDSLEIEVVSMAQGTARSAHLQSGDWVEVEAFAARVEFPSHQLVLRPQSQGDPRINKGIADAGRLRTCFDECLAQSSNREVFIEVDLRACANPSRMNHIEQAAHDLLQRMQSYCPDCRTPGYWVTQRLPGLPCSDCGLPTSGYRDEVWRCLRCQYRSVKARKYRAVAEPRHCSYCNP